MPLLLNSFFYLCFFVFFPFTIARIYLCLGLLVCFSFVIETDFGYGDGLIGYGFLSNAAQYYNWNSLHDRHSSNWFMVSIVDQVIYTGSFSLLNDPPMRQ